MKNVYSDYGFGPFTIRIYGEQLLCQKIQIFLKSEGDYVKIFYGYQKQYTRQAV